MCCWNTAVTRIEHQSRCDCDRATARIELRPSFIRAHVCKRYQELCEFDRHVPEKRFETHTSDGSSGILEFLALLSVGVSKVFNKDKKMSPSS